MSQSSAQLSLPLPKLSQTLKLGYKPKKKEQIIPLYKKCILKKLDCWLSEISEQAL